MWKNVVTVPLKLAERAKKESSGTPCFTTHAIYYTARNMLIVTHCCSLSVGIPKVSVISISWYFYYYKPIVNSIKEIFFNWKILLQVASNSLESSLLKYSAKEYFFRAALCHLCVDVLNAQHALERYTELYPAFQDSREYKLLKVISCLY